MLTIPDISLDFQDARQKNGPASGAAGGNDGRKKPARDIYLLSGGISDPNS